MALKKTHKQFRNAIQFWMDEDDPNATLLAMRACWWFIENVVFDDPARERIYWELRGMTQQIESYEAERNDAEEPRHA